MNYYSHPANIVKFHRDYELPSTIPNFRVSSRLVAVETMKIKEILTSFRCYVIDVTIHENIATGFSKDFSTIS